MKKAPKRIFTASEALIDFTKKFIQEKRNSQTDFRPVLQAELSESLYAELYDIRIREGILECSVRSELAVFELKMKKTALLEACQKAFPGSAPLDIIFR